MIPIWIQIVFALGIGGIVVGFWAWTRSQIVSLLIRIAQTETSIKIMQEGFLEHVKADRESASILTQVATDVAVSRAIVEELKTQLLKLEARAEKLDDRERAKEW